MGHSLSSINGDYLLDYNVIVVSLNYRLGAFGFLSVEGDPILTGNQVSYLYPALHLIL